MLFESLMGIPTVTAIHFHALPGDAILRQCSYFVGKGGIFWVDQLSSVFME